MKKEILRLLALLIFGAAALSGCSIENRGHRGRYDHYRHDGYRHHDGDRDYHYYNR
jgi:hypothetical protein